MKRPAAASALVEDALKRFDSAERIALVLGRAFRERPPQQHATSKGQGQPPKRKKRKTKKGSTARKVTTATVVPSSGNNDDSNTSSKNSPCWLHWLLECLYSPSLAIRQIVIRILHAHDLRDVRLLHVLKTVISMHTQPKEGDVQTFGLVLQCATTATEQKKTFLWACTLLNSEWAYASPFPQWTYQRFYLTLHLLHNFLSNGDEQAFLQHIYSHKDHLSYLIATHVRLHTLRHLPKYMDSVVQWLKKLVDPLSSTTLTTKGPKKARRVTNATTTSTNDVAVSEDVLMAEDEDHADDDEDDANDDEKHNDDDDDDDDDDEDDHDEEDEGEQDEDDEDNEDEENEDENDGEAHEETHEGAEVAESEEEEDQEYETEQHQEDMMEVENDHEIVSKIGCYINICHLSRDATSLNPCFTD